MNDTKLSELEAMFEQQNEALAEFEATLRDLGDVELMVPNTFFEELEELITAPTNITTPFTFALRG